ncbi:MAG: RNA polymerase sigma factor [Actinomycetota bacterium]
MSLGDQFDPVLAAARSGAEWALSALYQDLHPRLLRYLGSQEPREAEDLASEVWLDVAAGLSRFNGGEDAFRAWLFTIARRRLIDLRRSAARRRTQPVTTEMLAGLPDPGDPETEVIGLAATEAALAQIAALSPDQAEVVLLRVVAGLDVDEVAAVTGKRPGTIRVLQHRALKRLAEQISREAVTP